MTGASPAVAAWKDSHDRSCHRWLLREDAAAEHERSGDVLHHDGTERGRQGVSRLGDDAAGNVVAERLGLERQRCEAGEFDWTQSVDGVDGPAEADEATVRAAFRGPLHAQPRENQIAENRRWSTVVERARGREHRTMSDPEP